MARSSTLALATLLLALAFVQFAFEGNVLTHDRSVPLLDLAAAATAATAGSSSLE